jgi:hypothetical protein
MNKPVVMIVPDDRIDYLKELESILKENNILVKIMDHHEFDTMFNLNCETIQCDISDEAMLFLAEKAHKEDITINTAINRILREQLATMEKDSQNKN